MSFCDFLFPRRCLMRRQKLLNEANHLAVMPTNSQKKFNIKKKKEKCELCVSECGEMNKPFISDGNMLKSSCAETSAWCWQTWSYQHQVCTGPSWHHEQPPLICLLITDLIIPPPLRRSRNVSTTKWQKSFQMAQLCFKSFNSGFQACLGQDVTTPSLNVTRTKEVFVFLKQNHYLNILSAVWFVSHCLFGRNIRNFFAKFTN